jgi:Emfourin
MKIEYVRSGGLAGMRQAFSASSESLSAEERNQLAQLVQSSRFFDQPEVVRPDPTGADRFQYRISVESDQGTHTVQVSEGSVPTELQPLINWLINTSRHS